MNKIARNDRIYLRGLSPDDLKEIIELDEAVPVGIDKALNFNNYLYFNMRRDYLNNNPEVYKLQEAEYMESYKLEEYDVLSFFNKEVDDMVKFAKRFPILEPIIHVVYEEF